MLVDGVRLGEGALDADDQVDPGVGGCFDEEGGRGEGGGVAEEEGRGLLFGGAVVARGAVGGAEGPFVGGGGAAEFAG